MTTYLLIVDNDACLFESEYGEKDRMEIIRDIVLKENPEKKHSWQMDIFDLELYVFGSMDFDCLDLLHSRFLHDVFKHHTNYWYYTKEQIFGK